MQIISLGDSLHEMANPLFLRKKCKKKKTTNISYCLLKFWPSMLSVKQSILTRAVDAHIFAVYNWENTGLYF